VAQPWVIWAGITVSAPESSPLLDFCETYGDTADAYYYRAVCWCKKFHRSGQITSTATLAPTDVWRELARAIRWPRPFEELRDTWRQCRVVVGPADQLFDWEESNGRIMRAKEQDRLNKERKRKAGRASGKARRKKKRKRRQLSLLPSKRPAARQMPLIRKPRAEQDPER
jgi:hypothetical protein